MKKIAVIIPTFNSVKTVELAITSLINQTVKPDVIIVVNNGSTDKTDQILIRKFGKKINLINMNKNLGVTGGRNKGISQVKGYDFFLFFDHDMTADRKMVEELLKEAESSDEIGIVTPKIFYKSDKKRIWSAGTGINLWTGQILFRGGYDYGQYETVQEVQVAPACMLVKKEVLKKITKFDEKYFATYEDTDFCFRAKKAGFKTYYSPTAVAYHDIPFDKTAESVRLLSRAFWVGRNRILFMKDFGKSMVIFLIFYPVFALYYLKLALSYNNFPAWVDFMKGSWRGLINK